MDEECDFELVDGSAATDEHDNGTKNSVAVKWFRHETGQWRRFNCQTWTYTALMAQVRAIEPNFQGQLFYRDIDGDAIVFDTETEVQTMLLHHREQLKTDTIKLESKELKKGEEKQSLKDNGTAVDAFADFAWQDAYQLINGSRQNGDGKSTEHNNSHITTTAGGTHRQYDKPEQYKCMHCTHISRSHAKLHIPKKKQLTCELCGFVTEHEHYMEYHYRYHNGPKLFKCTLCQYTCVNEVMLNLHMKSHTSVFQFFCEDCAYQTKYIHSLKVHLKKYNHKRALGSRGFAESNSSHGESSQSCGHTPGKHAGTEEGMAENGKNEESQ